MSTEPLRLAGNIPTGMDFDAVLPTGAEMNEMSELDRILSIETRLELCPCCDAGLPANCTCPGVDEYREDVTYLLGVLRHYLRAPQA